MDLAATIRDFRAYTEKMQALQAACTMFNWDMQTGAPKGGTAIRAKYLGILHAEAFAMLVSAQMKDFIGRLEEHQDKLDETTAAMLRVCKRDYQAQANIPVAEMREYSELTAKAVDVWEAAKSGNDYALFAPVLDQIIRYQRKFIEYRGYTGHPYNTLLDDYEPGQTVESLDIFFAKLKGAIVPLLQQIQASGKQIETGFTKIPVPIEKQRQIAAYLMDKLDYDLRRGMLKETEHPFTSGFGKTDTRITTHYHEQSFLSSFYSVMHECGHAIYEQNIMDELHDTILETGISMGIHESQSRFYENIIGRSQAFWENARADIVSILGSGFKEVTPRQFYQAVNLAQPSLIRIEADELTYSLHIMVRYELEKQIFSGDFDINELPALWNEKMREYLGLTPPSDSRGILQDVHWSEGMFGYFPSYALGNTYAAQLLHYMERDMDVSAAVRKGDIAAVTAWLKDNIHQYGSLKTPAQLITAIAGEGLNADYYVKYLQNKYSEIYGL